MKKDDSKNKSLPPEETVAEIRPDSSLKGRVNHPIAPETLEAIIANRDTRLLNLTVQSYDPINIANALEKLEPQDILFFFKSVDSDDSAEVFTALTKENKEKVVKAFSDKELHDIIDPMQMDNLVDFVDELPANLTNKVLQAAEPDDRKRLYAYLKFKEDSAGTIMTPEFLYVKDTNSVEECLAEIRAHGQDKETVWMIFVVDSTRTLVGTVTLATLLESDPTDIVKSVMNDDYVYVSADTDEEAVLRAFRKYDISVMPVTNKERRILGIITFDDVMDVAATENTEDIQLSAAVIPSETPYLKRSIPNLVKSYSVWLVFLLFLDTFTSMILSYMDAPLAIFPILIAFLTPTMSANSNSADQTTTVIIREIALGNISSKNYWKVVWKETKTALLTGLMLALFLFTWTEVELNSGIIQLSPTDNSALASLYENNRSLFFLSVSLVSSLTALVSTVVAKFLGVSVPVLAKKIHIDPAVISQPMISTVLDIVSIAIYFCFSALIMKGIGF